MNIKQILDKVANTTKKSEKEKILKKYDNKILQKVIYYTYNSFFNYYVKKIPVPKRSGSWTIEGEFDAIEKFLKPLYNRVISGHTALDLIDSFLSTLTRDSQEVLTKLLKRDLKAGFSESTANKIWPNLIPTFEVALANRYDEKIAKRIDIFDGNWVTSRKLDGCRNLMVKKDGSIKLFSRNGKEFTTLGVLKNFMEKMTEGKDNIVLDGEICVLDKSGNESFPAIMKEIRKKDHTIERPKFYVFDYLTTDEFFSKESKRNLLDRLNKFKKDFKQLNKSCVELLDQVIVGDSSFAKMQNNVKEFNWEGLILRKNTTYKGKRSNDLLKVKKFFDAEYKVIATENDTLTFADKQKGQVTYETLKSVVIEHKGFKVRVGSGWTRQQRDLYYKSPEKIIGKTIQVKYFEETRNQKGELSLRFPTLGFIYENGRKD